MEYSITVSVDRTHILLKVRGDMTRRTAMSLNLEAHALGRKINVRRYLVDVTEARNTESEIENYKFAYADMLNTEGIDREARVAMLVSPDDHSHDFVETVAINAGLNVRRFADREAALRFLTADFSSG
jgi:hypothetical protein